MSDFRTVRIFFSKTGRAKYISHLDTVRTVTRAVRRCGMPIWYTEGFNPRPYLDFPRALPLGAEGLNEPLDVRITDNTPYDKIKEMLSGEMPEGFAIVSVAAPYMKPKEISFASYEIIYDKNEINREKLTGAVESGELKTEKIGKIQGRKVIKTVDISSYITEDSHKIIEDGDFVRLDITLPCSPDANINIIHVAKAIDECLKTDIVPENVRRVRLYDMNMSVFR